MSIFTGTCIKFLKLYNVKQAIEVKGGFSCLHEFICNLPNLPRRKPKTSDLLWYRALSTLRKCIERKLPAVLRPNSKTEKVGQNFKLFIFEVVAINKAERLWKKF